MLVPKLRFKREDGTEYPEWTGSLFGEYCKTIDLRTSDTDSFPLYSLTIEDGVTPKTDRYVRDYLITKEGDSYKIVPDGAFVYNPMNLRFGAIKPNRSGISVCVSGYYDVFYIGIKETLAFWENYLTTPNMLNYYDRIATGSLIEKKRVYYSEFQKIKKPLPCLEEQQKIADFLSTVDEVIAQSEAEVQNLEQQKKAAMQKIFSQEVRFKREDGTEYPAWEEKRLHQLVIPNDKIPVDTSKYRKITIGLRLKGVSFTETTREMADKRPFYLRKEGEIIVGKQNYFNGSIALITKEFNNTICSNAIMSFMPNDSVITLFLLSAISNNKYLKEREYMANGTGQKELSEKDFLNFSVSIPCLEEQQKIADFLSAYDEAISYAKHELDKWKELKKGLLQQMFV